jgi:hypothetical protein
MPVILREAKNLMLCRWSPGRSTRTPFTTVASKLVVLKHPAFRSVAIIVHHLLAIAPLLIVAALYASSFRGEAIIGHWPQPVHDDPYYVAPGDWLYTLFLYAVPTFFVIAHIAIVAFPVLTWTLRNRYARLWSAVLVIVFVAGWLLFRADPEGRFYWWLD